MKRKPKVYREMADWVRSIRKRLGVTQPKFAAMVGVSVVTLQRWEYAQGHMPGGWTTKNVHGRKVVSNMQRLKQLEKLADDLEKSGTPFEEK
jgi:DNA-binding XRE family transcriptional regulator